MSVQSEPAENDVDIPFQPPSDGLKITLISLHGLIRAKDCEFGMDADTGGQVKYVLELARELATRSCVREVELLTRQVIDPKVDPTYAQLDEVISPKARIVRIPFGPKRYLKKESLWPYIEMFVDQTLSHFRRAGLPDIIHGHYADAGMAGAQLSQLLHIPFIFTGHSLGRVKRKRFLTSKAKPETLERKFHFGQRIEAEERALETASLVVASTNQEVEEQYSLYDHYAASRMEVIPPGLDLDAFSPSTEDSERPAFADKLDAFLRDPKKPMILALARPDERKNINMLVEVFGKSEKLRELANLVLVLGTRDDMSELPRATRQVFREIFYAIDKYDLYGQVAYPKTHTPQDIPELYRLAADSRGVFVNPALTEPFGLTLLEAGAMGLPIVATNDGGPRDIIANCQNGLLIDPLNAEDIEHKLLRVLTEKQNWSHWSEDGKAGTRKYYSWANHVDRYIRDVQEIHEQEAAPLLVNLMRPRRLLNFDRLIITDLDNTLTGDEDAIREFVKLLKENEHVGFGVATGRRLDSALELIEELGLPRPDLIDSDCGTQLHYGEKLLADLSWRKSIGFAWNPEGIRAALDPLPGFFLQDETHQSEYKISYEIDPEKSPKPSRIKKILREAGLRAKVIFSLGMYLDVIPVRGGSGMTMRHFLWKWGFAPEQVLVAGDSGNDAEMLLGRTLGIVVANHSKELNRLRKHPRVYFAENAHAAGLLEGIEYYNFLGQITIPNDRVE